MNAHVTPQSLDAAIIADGALMRAGWNAIDHLENVISYFRAQLAVIEARISAASAHTAVGAAVQKEWANDV